MVRTRAGSGEQGSGTSKETWHAIHDDRQGGRELRGWRRAEARVDRRERKTVGRNDQGRGVARHGWSAAELERRTHQRHAGKIDGDRRPLQRSQGADRRLRNSAGEVQGRSDRTRKKVHAATRRRPWTLVRR